MPTTVRQHRKAAFELLVHNHLLFPLLWNLCSDVDVRTNTVGAGTALHTVVGLVLNAWKRPALRKKLEAILLDLDL